VSPLTSDGVYSLEANGRVAPERVSRMSGDSKAPPIRPAGAYLANPGHLKRDAHDPDYVLLVAVVALAAIGILMVYSASAIPSYAQSNNTFQMVAPQIASGLVGLAVMLVLMRLDYRYLRVASVPLAIFALLLLLIVLTPAGTSVNGAARWIRIGSIPEIHPAEVAKLALVVYLAHWLATRGTGIRSFLKGTLPFAIIVVPFLFLVAKEPDLGTASVIILLAFALFFVAGANMIHIALAGLAGVAGGIVAILTVGTYPLERINTLLNPWSDPTGKGYHTLKGLEAISAGGIFGTGLGNDKVIVPNDFNDFIFSVIAQEFGLIGGVIVIGLFVAFAYAGIRTAIRAPDTFGGLLAAGITAWICFQALINIGVVVAVIPVTGITLPFVSAGGTSLVVSFAAVGILLSVSRETVERGWVSASADSGRGYGGTYLPGSRRGKVATGTNGRV
jgi:cell division protein FtsW